MPDRSLVVVGDVFLDRDVVGRAERLVPDAPVPVVEGCTATIRPGGAGLAALLAARARSALGDELAVTLIGALGDDAEGRRCERALRDAGVKFVNLRSADDTGCKVRVRAGRQLVARLDHGGAQTRPATLPDVARRTILEADAVLVSDYARGTTSFEPLRDALTAAAARHPTVWDPHPRGTPAVEGVRLLTPNAAEAEHFTGRCTARGLARNVEQGRALGRAWGAASVAVTLGPLGAVLIDGDGPPLMVPAAGIADADADACGAGDVFAVHAAMAMGQGSLTSEAVVMAVEAASSFVESGGVATVLFEGGERRAKRGGARLMSDVYSQIESVRRDDGVVVAAGGCFDLLHVGHIEMLRAAAALGDYLVVCVNSDSSVRGLKGPTRPIVNEMDRAAVVGALSFVDGVVLFDDPTPVPILERLRPEIFVKGGDYAHQVLPEDAVLRRWGGQVVVVPYVSGRSTTNLIAEVSRDG